ncbi:dihydroorotate oxidase [Candidatus Saccharibacteria bacterium CG_4_10_14_0_2_um_filter_52_9]|nr:MAG: dihydroorotate oxidase [Candidatus Saccharibacteria bacterium CG_4_10_14_0_2_um_filter_52_9]
MSDFTPWLYDPKLSFADNLRLGPFGDFDKKPAYKNNGEPQYDFFGTKVYSPFGIAAGPLPQAKFVKSALDRGYDIVTFKTVRSHLYPVHPEPNTFPLEYKKFDPKKPSETYTVKGTYDFPLTLANSFGIPSFEPDIWQKEIKESFKLLGKGQALLVAFQGTLQPDGREKFIEDHVYGVGKLRETGARLIEINLSCPNEGHSNLLCFDIETSTEIVKQVKLTYPDLNLIVKLSYFYDDGHLREFVEAVGPYIAGIAAFNTLQSQIIDKKGERAFNGPATRAIAGVSGEAVKHLCIDMVQRLADHRQKLNADFKIVGVGGVQTVEDFHNLRRAGADYVMGLTGVMWNPNLAAEIKASL